MSSLPVLMVVRSRMMAERMQRFLDPTAIRVVGPFTSTLMMPKASGLIIAPQDEDLNTEAFVEWIDTSCRTRLERGAQGNIQYL